MCSSRKSSPIYLSSIQGQETKLVPENVLTSPQERFFSKDPHPIPLEIPVKLYTFSLNFLVFQNPPPHPPGDFNLFSGGVLIFSGTAHYEIWSIKHTHGNNCKGVYLKGNVCGLFEIICNKCVSQSKEESSAYLIIFHMDQVV